MIWGLMIPNLCSAILMLVDEAYFHRRRGLPRWERIGHPLDTLTLLLCYGVAIFFPPSPTYLAWYVGLAVFSCLFVIKDEKVHTENCGPGEHYLHALLFILHPIILTAVALLWWWPGMEGAHLVLQAQALLTLLFGLYQLIYWNWLWRP